MIRRELRWSVRRLTESDRQLSIHSFIDGRVLGRCHVGDAISSSARQGTLAFAGFELIAHEEVSLLSDSSSIR